MYSPGSKEAAAFGRLLEAFGNRRTSTTYLSVPENALRLGLYKVGREGTLALEIKVFRRIGFQCTAHNVDAAPFIIPGEIICVRRPPDRTLEGDAAIRINPL